MNSFGRWPAVVVAFSLAAAPTVAACGSDGAGDVADAGGDGPLFAGDGSDDPGFEGCATDTRQAERQPVDMMIALDTSFSMDFDDKWINVREAMKSFVANPAYADLGIGLQFFPIRKLCSAVDYGVPAVPLALQSGVAGPIILALDAQRMADGTPMVPLLEGLSTYAVAVAKPGRKMVLVLATDGVPDSTCLGGGESSLPNTLDNAVAVAKRTFEGAASIPTFVIGVGGELTALNAISRAGGTGDAIIIDATTGVIEATFLAALDAIRGQSIPCDYAVPTSGIDPTKANVTYAPAGAAAETLLFVGSETDCSKAPSNGWYFDDEANPTKVILCPAACEAVKKDDRGRIDVVYGCPRVSIR